MADRCLYCERAECPWLKGAPCEVAALVDAAYRYLHGEDDGRFKSLNDLQKALTPLLPIAYGEQDDAS